MGKGYLYLKYNLDIKVLEISKIEEGKVSTYFEYTSFPTDLTDIKGHRLLGSFIEYLTVQEQRFGAQGTNYLVPNVSITDTTRMN